MKFKINTKAIARLVSKALVLMLTGFLVFGAETSSVFGAVGEIEAPALRADTINRVDLTTKKVYDTMPFFDMDNNVPASLIIPEYSYYVVQFLEDPDYSSTLYTYTVTDNKWHDGTSRDSSSEIPEPTDYMDCKYIFYILRITVDPSLAFFDKTTTKVYLDGVESTFTTDPSAFITAGKTGSVYMMLDSGEYVEFGRLLTMEDFKALVSASKDDAATTPAVEAVPTGDANGFAVLLVMMLASFMGAGYCLRKKRVLK